MRWESQQWEAVGAANIAQHNGQWTTPMLRDLDCWAQPPGSPSPHILALQSLCRLNLTGLPWTRSTDPWPPHRFQSNWWLLWDRSPSFHWALEYLRERAALLCPPAPLKQAGCVNWALTSSGSDLEELGHLVSVSHSHGVASAHSIFSPKVMGEMEASGQTWCITGAMR